jgi:hypothetical protein
LVYLAKTFYYLNILIVSVAILIQLGQYAYAISGHDSGYNHGCNDAKVADPSQRYINQPEKGPNFHSDAFMQGYKSGFNSCSVQLSDSLPPSGSPSQTPLLPTVSDQGDETSFGIAIIIVILFVISSITLAIRKFKRKVKRKDKHRKRQHFSDSVKEKILRKQNHKCAHCKRILNVVDWDHKNGNRSNNTESNCQALCPNCHAIKTRSIRKYP